MSDVLEVEERPEVGTRPSRKLREDGRLPAVLYGHEEDPVSLVVRADQLRKVLKHGGKVVELKGAASGQALLQDTQWDTFGRHLLHLDLLRVAAGETLTVEIAVELKGEAIGAREGGVVEQTLRTVQIEAPPSAIPEHIYLDITELALHGSMTAGDVTGLPEGAKLVTDASEVLVHCVPAAKEVEETDAAPTGAEPEIVGAKGGDEDSD
ncbi:MAG: 50S ribosomal protein L25 [Planctomycetota bacterium]